VSKQLKPLPSRLNIVGIEWVIDQSIERWAALIELGDEKGVVPGSAGHTSFGDQIISLDPNLNLPYSWISLIHELLHVLEVFVQPNEDWRESNERFIEAIDEPLFVFLRDTFGVGVK